MPLIPPAPEPDATSPIASASALLKGNAFGRVYPGPPSPPLEHKDAREHALRTFALFVSLLNFTRTGDTPDARLMFRVPLERVHVYQPDDIESKGPQDGIGILPGRAIHEPYGLGPPEVLDDSADKFGDGLVLVRRSDHVETVGVEVVAAKHSELLGVIAGLKEALQMDDKSGALRLRLDSYYGIVASFRLDESEAIDDADSTLNRRRGHLYVLMQVPEVALVRYRKAVIVATLETGRGINVE